MFPRVFISTRESRDAESKASRRPDALPHPVRSVGCGYPPDRGDTLLSGDDSQPDGEGEYQGPDSTQTTPDLLVVTDSRGGYVTGSSCVPALLEGPARLCPRPLAEHLTTCAGPRHTIIAGEDKVDSELPWRNWRTGSAAAWYADSGAR